MVFKLLITGALSESNSDYASDSQSQNDFCLSVWNPVLHLVCVMVIRRKSNYLAYFLHFMIEFLSLLNFPYAYLFEIICFWSDECFLHLNVSFSPNTAIFCGTRQKWKLSYIKLFGKEMHIWIFKIQIYKPIKYLMYILNLYTVRYHYNVTFLIAFQKPIVLTAFIYCIYTNFMMTFQ